MRNDLPPRPRSPGARLLTLDHHFPAHEKEKEGATDKDKEKEKDKQPDFVPEPVPARSWLTTLGIILGIIAVAGILAIAIMALIAPIPEPIHQILAVLAAMGLASLLMILVGKLDSSPSPTAA